MIKTIKNFFIRSTKSYFFLFSNRNFSPTISGWLVMKTTSLSLSHTHPHAHTHTLPFFPTHSHAYTLAHTHAGQKWLEDKGRFGTLPLFSFFHQTTIEWEWPSKARQSKASSSNIVPTRRNIFNNLSLAASAGIMGPPSSLRFPISAPVLDS